MPNLSELGATTLTWTEYSVERPASEGLFEWSVPVVRTPGVRAHVLAHMRKRGAGYREAISPAFDYWDGYNLRVPTGTLWRETAPDPELKPYSVRLVSLEGVGEICPCPFCKRVPTFKGITRDGVGVIITAEPHQFNTWWLECCAWAKTPHVSDPIKLVADRNALLRAALAKALGEPQPKTGDAA